MSYTPPVGEPPLASLMIESSVFVPHEALRRWAFEQALQFSSFNGVVRSDLGSLYSIADSIIRWVCHQSLEKVVLNDPDARDAIREGEGRQGRTGAEGKTGAGRVKRVYVRMALLTVWWSLPLAAVYLSLRLAGLPMVVAWPPYLLACCVVGWRAGKKAAVMEFGHR